MILGFRFATDSNTMFDSTVLENVVLLGMCVAAYVVPHYLLKALFVRLGILTRIQASDLVIGRRWPDSWLETESEERTKL